MALTQNKVLKNIKNYKPKVEMQKKYKKSTKKFRERERERGTFFLWGKTMHRIEEIVTNL